MTKAERTRQFIIEQSAPIFNTKGLAATAMSDIMEATKMAKGGLYGHFNSKEHLAYAVVDYNLQKLVGKVVQSTTHGSAKEKLYALLVVFEDPLQFPVDGGCPILNFGVEADDGNAVIRAKVAVVIHKAQKRIAGIILAGIENGELKPGINAEEFAIKMFSMVEGSTLICRVLNNNNQMKTIISMLKREIDEFSV